MGWIIARGGTPDHALLSEGTPDHALLSEGTSDQQIYALLVYPSEKVAMELQEVFNWQIDNKGETAT